MCICCCSTRKVLIIYGIVITVVAFIYEIAVMSNFGSRTKYFKILMKEFEFYKAINAPNPDIMGIYLDIYNFYLPYGDVQEFYEKYKLNYYYLETDNYGLSKKLKGLEYGFVIPFFIFTIIFLAAEIAYLYFAYGIGEYQLLKAKTYKVLNILKIITFIFSTIFVALNICFFVLVLFAYMQYIDFDDYLDSCLSGMLMDLFLGVYNLYFYLNLVCIFYKELSLFRKVGSEIRLEKMLLMM